MENYHVRLCAALISLSLTRPKSLSSLALTRYVPHPEERLLTWLIPLSAGPGALYLVLNLNAFIFLLVCKIIQTSQSHPLTGTWGHFIILLQQNLPPIAPTCSVCSQVQSNAVMLLIKKIKNKKKHRQSSSGIFHRNRTNILNTCVETQRTLNSQRHREKRADWRHLPRRLHMTWCS